MKLVHFLVGSQEGGAEAFFMKLIEAQHEAGDEILVILGPHEGRVGQLEALGVRHLVLKFEGLIEDFMSRRSMARALSAFGPDVVQCWMSRAGRRTKVGPYLTVGRQGGYYPVKHYKGCDHLVANTPAIVDFIKSDGWPETNVHLISNFGSLGTAEPIDRGDLETPASAKVILAMGRLDPSKGFDVLLEALAKLPSDYYLWLAGTGPIELRLKGQAEMLGVQERVRFLGWRDDAAALYSQADVYAMSSRDEPLGNVVLEAWSAKVPVVAAQSRGPSWIISEGEDGLMVPQEDPEAMANAIEEVCNNLALREALISKALETYEARFSKASILDQYREFYRSAYLEKFGREIKS